MWNGLAGEYGTAFPSDNSQDINDKTTVFHTWQDRSDPEGDIKVGTQHVECYDPADFNTNSMVNEIYIGADDPQLSFNASQSRFQFSKLHSAEVVGNNWKTASEVADASLPCYKINKRLSRLNYSPTFIPYGNTSSSILPDYLYLDKNIVPYSIMDAHSGVFFEDYGCDEVNWSKSLWELLGYSYEQFHQLTDNRLVRTHNLGLTTSTPTTNAQINTADFRNFTKIQSGSDTISYKYK